MSKVAKLVEDGIYATNPPIEGKKFVTFKYKNAAWWDDHKAGMQILDLAGNVVKVVENTQTTEDALKELGYEILKGE